MNFYTTIFDLLSSLGLDNGIYGYTLCSFVSTALSYIIALFPLLFIVGIFWRAIKR